MNQPTQILLVFVILNNAFCSCTNEETKSRQKNLLNPENNCPPKCLNESSNDISDVNICSLNCISNKQILNSEESRILNKTPNDAPNLPNHIYKEKCGLKSNISIREYYSTSDDSPEYLEDKSNLMVQENAGINNHRYEKLNTSTVHGNIKYSIIKHMGFESKHVKELKAKALSVSKKSKDNKYFRKGTMLPTLNIQYNECFSQEKIKSTTKLCNDNNFIIKDTKELTQNKINGENKLLREILEEPKSSQIKINTRTQELSLIKYQALAFYFCACIQNIKSNINLILKNEDMKNPNKNMRRFRTLSNIAYCVLDGTRNATGGLYEPFPVQLHIFTRIQCLTNIKRITSKNLYTPAESLEFWQIINRFITAEEYKKLVNLTGSVRVDDESNSINAESKFTLNHIKVIIKNRKEYAATHFAHLYQYICLQNETHKIERANYKVKNPSLMKKEILENIISAEVKILHHCKIIGKLNPHDLNIMSYMAIFDQTSDFFTDINFYIKHVTMFFFRELNKYIKYCRKSLVNSAITWFKNHTSALEQMCVIFERNLGKYQEIQGYVASQSMIDEFKKFLDEYNTEKIFINGVFYLDMIYIKVLNRLMFN